MAERKRDPETGQFLKQVTTWETDWDLDEIKFKTPDGTAVYKYAGLVPFVKEVKRTTKTLHGTPTWETEGYEEVERDGCCAVCGKRVFIHEEGTPLAEEEIGDRIVAWKKTGPNEPPLAYCQTCIRQDPDVKAQLDEQERLNNYVPSAYERELARKTAELGGPR